MLYRDGPQTEGVFRKAGNARALKDIKEKLNNGVEVDLKNAFTVILLADLLKVTLTEFIYQYGMMFHNHIYVVFKYMW